MPLFRPGEIFQSKLSSKSLYVSLAKRSSTMRGRVTAFRHPSSMTNESPGGDFFVGSSHPANDLPSNMSCQPAAFSLAVSWLSAARNPPAAATAQASAPIRITFHIRSLCHAGGHARTDSPASPPERLFKYLRL